MPAAGAAIERERPGMGSRGPLSRGVRAPAGGGDVAAGHTKTDQVETILYRLASSPSRRALLGMRPREGSLVRPLLGFTREETAAYCLERGLRWREDESNASPAYARNRIRAEVVPALRGVHAAAEDNVLAVARILREEGEVLDALVDEVVGQGSSVSLSVLRSLPPALRRLVVQRMADDAASGFAPGAGGRAEEIAALSDRGTATLDVGNGLRAIAEYGALRFEPLGAGAGAGGSAPVTAPDSRGACRSDRSRFGASSPSPRLSRAMLDRASLGTEAGGPVVAGPATGLRRSGSAGRRACRTCSPRGACRGSSGGAVPVVESGGEIAWVAGVATSERFKVTPATREAVRLSCRS